MKTKKMRVSKDGITMTQILIPLGLKKRLKEYASINRLKLYGIGEQMATDFLRSKNFLP